MNRFLVSNVIFAIVLCFSTVTNGKELVREFKGSSSKVTADFEVKAPWIVDWRVSGDYPGQMALDAHLVNTKTGEHMGKIVTTRYVSNGVRLIDESGTFHFQVNSSLVNWTLRAEQLTRAEAETYKPKIP